MNRMEEVFSVMKKAEPKEKVKCESCSEMPSVSFCHDCKEYICAECVKAHKRLRKLSSHKIVSIDSLRSNVSKGHGSNLSLAHCDVTCAKHMDESLKLYCRDCHKLVCRDCILIDHKDHRYAFVTDAAPLCKAEIKENVMSVSQISEGLKVAAKSLNDSEKKLISHGTAAIKSIDNALDEVAAQVARKRKELKEKVCCIISDSKQKINSEEKNIQLAMAEINSLLEFMNQIIARATDQEVLSLEKQISHQVERMTRIYSNPAGKFQVPELPELVFQCGAGVRKALETDISVSDVDSLFTSIILSPEDFDFVEQVKQRDFPPNVECTFDPSRFSVMLKGPKGTITKLKESMEDIISHSDIPVFLDPMVTEYFKTPTGRGKVEKFLQERQCHPALHFAQTPTLVLHFLADHKEASKVKAVVAQLPHHVTSQGIPIPETVVPIISDFEEFFQLCQATEKKYEVLIKHVGHDVSVAGFKIQATSSLAEIQAFLAKLAFPNPPLEINVSTLVAKSLHRSPHGLQKCIIASVRLFCDTVRGVLQFTPLHYMKPGWEETCQGIVSKYISKNMAEVKKSVPGEAYSEVMKELYISDQDDDTLVYYYPPSATVLSLAGRPDTVRMIQEKVNQICASHSFAREEVSLKPEVYEFLTQLKMEHLTNKFRSVEIEPVPETHSLMLSGIAKVVKDVKEHIPSITNVVSVHIDLDTAIIQYLGTENGRVKLFSLLRDKKADRCAVCISESPAKFSLVCIQKNRTATEKASRAITGNTSMQPLDIPDLLLPYISQLSEFTAMVKSLERELPVIITVEEKKVIVAGFKYGVTHAADNLSAFVKQKMIHFQPLVIPIDSMIASCMQSGQESLQTCMSSIHVVCKLKYAKQSLSVTMYPTKEAKSDWKEECQIVLSSYIDKEYLKETFKVPKEAARDVFRVLAAATTKQNLTFEMDDDNECATVAGERSVVEAVQIKIDRIFTQTQTMETRKLSKRDYEYFTQVVRKKLKSETEIELAPEMHSLTASGSVHAVGAMMKSMQETVQHEVVPVLVDQVVVQFIHTQGRKKLKSLMHQQRIEAAIYVNVSVKYPALELLCQEKSVQQVRAFAETFPKSIDIIALPLPKTVATPPISQEFSHFCKELAPKHEVSIVLKPDTLQICGFKDSTSEAQKSVEWFIKKKCTVSRAFAIHRGMWRLLGGRMKPKWVKIENVCRDSEIVLLLQSDDDDKQVIEFKGDKTTVLKAIEAMNSLITSIETATVPLKRPEIRRYFSEKEDGGMKIPGIERNARVCIELCVVGEDEEWGVEDYLDLTDEPEFKTTSVRSVPKMSKECTAQVGGMKRITIHVGDITEFRADVIVNAANEDLKHIGGVADSVLKKGGRVIQDASDRYTKSHGKLSAGDVWLSRAVGKLSCLALVHAVGPRWHGNPAGKQQLRKVCINALKVAKDYNSIALPAISSGVFGCPMDECAEVIVSATVEFCRKSQTNVSLDDINIVLFQQSDAIHFVQALKAHLPPGSIQHKRSAYAQGSPQPQPSYFEDFPPSSSEHLSEEEVEVEVSEEETVENEAAATPSSLSRVQVQQGSILDVEVRNCLSLLSLCAILCPSLSGRNICEFNKWQHRSVWRCCSSSIIQGCWSRSTG